MSTQENTATEKRDVYERVTSQIVNAIESGVSNWRMPWHTSGKFAFSPINVASKKPIQGYQYPVPVGCSTSEGL
jgi:antirestriction protein ArdC